VMSLPELQLHPLHPINGSEAHDDGEV
jgi:hypothetical protein